MTRPLRCLALAFVLTALGGGAADALEVQATLIHASNQRVAQDQRLEFVEYRLRRIFPFESYAWMSQAGVTFPGHDGEATLNLGHGMTAHVRTTSRRGRIAAQVRWMRGNQVLLGTEVVTDRRTPSVLGGVPHQDGTLILVLVFR